MASPESYLVSGPLIYCIWNFQLYFSNQPIVRKVRQKQGLHIWILQERFRIFFIKDIFGVSLNLFPFGFAWFLRKCYSTLHVAGSESLSATTNTPEFYLKLFAF